MEMIDVMFSYVLSKYLKLEKKKKMKYRIHSVISERLFTGHFYMKCSKLLENSEQFFNYYRMCK